MIELTKYDFKHNYETKNMHNVQIFVINTSGEFSEILFKKMQAQLPANSKCKQENLFYSKAKFISCVGELLAVYAIRVFLQNNSFEVEFAYQEKGKPFLLHEENVHFNISHSGDYVACAVAGVEVGLDIERMRKPNLEIAKRFFAAEEYNDLQNLQAEEQTTYFLKLWNIKESYLKAIGTGIAENLDTFTVKKIKNTFVLKNALPNYRVKTFDINARYFGAVTALGNFNILLKPIHLDELCG